LWLFYLFALVFGLSWGGLGNQIAVLVSDIFGTRNVGKIMGALITVYAIGGAIGPAIGGFAFDVSNNYVTAFAIGAATMLIAAILAALVRPEPVRI